MENADKTVFVDMDGTIVDFDTAAVQSVPKQYHVARNNFYITEDYPAVYHSGIEATYNAPDFFENLELIPGVIEAWQTLIDNGYHPRILSAPLSSNPDSVEGKKKSLERLLVPHFGKSVLDEAIFDKNKWRYEGIAIIDDRPNLPHGIDGQETAVWKHILFGWPHLEVVPAATTELRLKSWTDTDTLLALLKSIRSQSS